MFKAPSRRTHIVTPWAPDGSKNQESKRQPVSWSYTTQYVQTDRLIKLDYVSCNQLWAKGTQIVTCWAPGRCQKHNLNKTLFVDGVRNKKHSKIHLTFSLYYFRPIQTKWLSLRVYKIHRMSLSMDQEMDLVVDQRLLHGGLEQDHFPHR